MYIYAKEEKVRVDLEYISTSAPDLRFQRFGVGTFNRSMVHNH